MDPNITIAANIAKIPILQTKQSKHEKRWKSIYSTMNVGIITCEVYGWRGKHSNESSGKLMKRLCQTVEHGSIGNTCSMQPSCWQNAVIHFSIRIPMLTIWSPVQTKVSLSINKRNLRPRLRIFRGKSNTRKLPTGEIWRVKWWLWRSNGLRYSKIFSYSFTVCVCVSILCVIFKWECKYFTRWIWKKNSCFKCRVQSRFVWSCRMKSRWRLCVAQRHLFQSSPG